MAKRMVEKLRQVLVDLASEMGDFTLIDHIETRRKWISVNEMLGMAQSAISGFLAQPSEIEGELLEQAA